MVPLKYSKECVLIYCHIICPRAISALFIAVIKLFTLLWAAISRYCVWRCQCFPNHTVFCWRQSLWKLTKEKIRRKVVSFDVYYVTVIKIWWTWFDEFLQTGASNFTVFKIAFEKQLSPPKMHWKCTYTTLIALFQDTS